MTAIDTKEKLDWLLEALENNEIQIVSGGLTEEEKKNFQGKLPSIGQRTRKPLPLKRF
jgi:hypothetical protein